MHKREVVWFFVITLVYIWAVMAQSARSPFWFDEIFTEAVAGLPHISDIPRAIQADGNPPLTVLLTRLAHKTFGAGELVARLPEIAGFWAMCAALFLFVRRRAGAAWGFSAMTLPMVTGAFHWATEARAYALVLGFGAVALFSWQTAVQEQGRKKFLALLSMGSSIAIALCAHYYAVQLTFGLVCGELIRSYRSRSCDWGVWISLLAALSPLLFLRSIAMGTSHAIFAHVQNAPQFAYSSRLSSPYHFFLEIISPAIPTLFLAVVVMLCTSIRSATPTVDRERTRKQAEFPEYEFVALLVFCLLPIIMTVITRLTTGHFFPRYALPAVIGYVVLSVFLGSLVRPGWSIPPVAIVLCCLGTVGLGAARGSMWAIRDPLRPGLSGTERNFPNSDHDPIVVSDPMAFLPAFWYSPSNVSSRLYYLTDLRETLKVPDFVPEIALVRSKTWSSFPVISYSEFLKQHSSFWVYSTHNRFVEWLLPKLSSDCKIITFRGSIAEGVLYRVSK